MLVITEVLDEARRLGVQCTMRTFWKYHSLQLLPAGRKRGGRGNVLYFPTDTPERLRLLDFLNKEAGISLETLRQMRSWLQGERVDASLLWERPTPVKLMAWFALALKDVGLWQSLRQSHGRQRVLSKDELAGLKELRNRLNERLGKAGVEW